MISIGYNQLVGVSQWSVYEFIVRNWAMLTIIATICVIIGICVLVIGRYVKIMLNILKDTPPPFSMGPLDFKRIEGQIVRFRAFDGTSLRGMFLFCDSSVKRKGMILFCHEFSSDMYSCARYCSQLLSAGYDIFTFDFRGHGESSSEEGYKPRQWVSDREIDDTLGAIAFVEDYLESNNLPIELGMFGISRGAGAAIIASMHNPRIKAIVTDGLFSTDLTIEALMKKWASIFAKVRFVYENHPPVFWRFLRWVVFIFVHRQFNCYYPSVKKALLRMIPRPILMIHGQRDSYISVEQAKYLFELIGEPKELWIVPSAKHNQAVVVAPEEYSKKTISFFDKYLANCNETADENSEHHIAVSGMNAGDAEYANNTDVNKDNNNDNNNDIKDIGNIDSENISESARNIARGA